MKKILLMAGAMLISGVAMAATDHYVLRDGSHVQHLKITKIGDDVTVAVDADFEPNASEQGKRACAADVAGEAKMNGENEVVLKKQIEGEKRYCTLTIKLSNDGAKIEQSEDCNYFAAGICHFDTQGKELIKVK